MTPSGGSEAGGGGKVARFLLGSLLLVVAIGLLGAIAMVAMVPSGIPAAWSGTLPRWIWAAMAWSVLLIPLTIIAILAGALALNPPGHGVNFR